MRLDNRQVYSYMTDIGMKSLYHANTVKTSCSFASAGGLLTRQAVTCLGLPQTSQSSDGIDVKYGIYNDLFFDSDDIHRRIKDKNHYGPVLFSLSIDVLLHPGTEIWITKSNPWNWIGIAAEQRYFSSVQELAGHFSIGTFGQIITLRNWNGALPFDRYLQSIAVDNIEILDIVRWSRKVGQSVKL